MRKVSWWHLLTPSGRRNAPQVAQGSGLLVGVVALDLRVQLTEKLCFWDRGIHRACAMTSCWDAPVFWKALLVFVGNPVGGL